MAKKVSYGELLVSGLKTDHVPPCCIEPGALVRIIYLWAVSREFYKSRDAYMRTLDQYFGPLQHYPDTCLGEWEEIRFPNRSAVIPSITVHYLVEFTREVFDLFGESRSFPYFGWCSD